MCGLAGFTFSDTSSRDHETIIADMLRRIEHRGPDEDGVMLTDALALGHNRLTIIEPDGGQQPRCHEASGNTLIFNGEIYNHRAFDAKIQAAGGVLRDHCDTETLFWLLQLFGVEKTLSMVDGMFAFAWYEAGTETLYLARDRFGQKPLFYAEAGGELIFASEIKALRKHPALSEVAPDFTALRLYLLMEYVPGQATGIDGIAQLPAGHYARYRKGALDMHRYWHVEDTNRDPGIDMDAAVDTLDDMLQEVVQEQLVADVPVGIFLSGGLDSSLIAAVARRHHENVDSFTVKFPFSSFDESTYAEEVAARIGTRHTTVELDRRKCVDGLEFLIEHADQPFADSSMLPSYLLCQATREYVTVALGGDGADELFFGYPNFKLLWITRLMAALPVALGTALSALANRLPSASGYMNRAFLLRQFGYGIGRPAPQQSSYWMAAVPPQVQELLWRNASDSGFSLASELQKQLPAGERYSLKEACQYQFINSYLSGDILQKMDRASMNASLEVRSPYLSNAVSDFALSLPVRAHHRGMTGKRILKKVAGRYLPERTVARRKHGFALPVSAMLRSSLKQVAASTLLDASNPLYECVHFEVVQDLWDQHMAQKRDNGKALLSLLMMAAFYRNQF